MAYMGLNFYYGYDQYSKSVDNSCGQAVIGSYLNWISSNPWGLKKVQHPSYYKDSRYKFLYYQPDALLGRIFRAHGPLLSTATAPGQILQTFAAYSVPCVMATGGPLTNPTHAATVLKQRLSAGQPVICVIGFYAYNPVTHKSILGQPRGLGLHYVTVYAVDDDYVYIATWDRWYKEPWTTFLAAWQALPGFGHIQFHPGR